MNLLANENQLFYRFLIVCVWKLIIYFLLLISCISTIYAQDVSGIWMSYNNGVSEISQSNRLGEDRMLVNFDKKTITNIETNSTIDFSIKLKKSRIKAKGKKGKLFFQKLGADSMVMKGAKNVQYNLEKLNLIHEIALEENDIASYLIDQQCDAVAGHRLFFTSEQFPIDKQFRQPHTKHRLINENLNTPGYWFVRKIKENAFIVFTMGTNEPENIFQITSIALNGFKLMPLQHDKKLKNVNLLKTCL